MTNHVSPSHITPRSCIFIFQQAAARAYIRVQCGSNRANAFDTGLVGDTSSRESLDPVSHPRCAFPRMSVFSVLTECLQECQSCFPSLGDSRAIYQCHQPEQNRLVSSLYVFSDIPSYCARERVKKRLPFSPKNQRYHWQPPRDVLMQTPNSGDTSNKESHKFSSRLSGTRSCLPIALEDDPLSISPEVHDDTSQSAVTKSNVHQSHYSPSQRLLHL
jgi:hypothetical protein